MTNGIEACNFPLIKIPGLKYIEKNITQYSNLEELDFRDNQQIFEENFDSLDKWIRRYQDGRLKLAKWVLQDVQPYGTICELGAGGCWLSATLSTLSEVKDVYAVEFSKTLLTRVAPTIIKEFNGIAEKITLTRSDFYDTGFEDKFFDFIFFDASQQSVNDYPRLFTELTRILKPNGKIIAMREPILFPLRKGFQKVFQVPGHPEITENIYSVHGWKRLCRDNDFNLKLVFKAFAIRFFNRFAEQLFQLTTIREIDYKKKFSNLSVRMTNKLILRWIYRLRNKIIGDDVNWNKYYFIIELLDLS